jgi:hypothetical protein
MTMWYETYYDVWLGGQFIHKIADLHKKHGKNSSNMPLLVAVH